MKDTIFMKEMPKPQGIDALIIPALTDLEECWYGISIDKSKFKIEVNETDGEYELRIIHRKSYKERIEELNKGE